MKKDTLLEIILGAIGGLIFAIGRCMCLIPEWDLLKVGVVISFIGFIVLLCIIPVYRSTHSKEQHEKINFGNRICFYYWYSWSFNYGIWYE